MLGKLIVVAQAASVEHLVFVHDDGIVHAAAQGQAIGPHGLDILGKAEGAGAGNVAGIRVGAHVKHHTLASGIHRRMGKINLKAQPVAVVGLQPGPFFCCALTLLHRDCGEQPNEAARGLLLHDARALEQKHKRGGRAVKNRQLFGADIHVQVVHAQAGAGRHQMLHCVHLDRSVCQGAGQPGV